MDTPKNASTDGEGTDGTTFFREATVFVVPEMEIDGDTGPYRVSREDSDAYRGRRLVTIKDLHLAMPEGWGNYRTGPESR